MWVKPFFFRGLIVFPERPADFAFAAVLTGERDIDTYRVPSRIEPQLLFSIGTSIAAQECSSSACACPWTLVMK